MRMFRPDRVFSLVVLLGAFLSCVALSAQQRDVVSSEIAVSSGEATLRLEFRDGEDFEISLQNGELTIGGEVAGTYTRGDALDTEWRTLLGRAVALDDGPLAQALREWEPPQDLPGSMASLATTIDVALEAALQAPTTEEPDVPARGLGLLLDTVRERSLVEALLLGRTSRLGDLGRALEGVHADRIRFYVDEDVVVGEGEVVDATLVVVDGNLDVHGTVAGDIIVTGGSLRVRESARVEGDVRLADARLLDREGTVSGRIRVVEEEQDQVEDLREVLQKRRAEPDLSFLRPLRDVGRGIAGIIQNLITFVILAGIGLGVVHFAGEKLAVVASAARSAPGRSAVVGLAGAFLTLPVWVLGMVVLAVSIIGIPVLIVWIPLFPLAVAAAVGLGFVAVARNVGRWLDDQAYPWLDWLDSTNPRLAVVGGIGALMVPFVAGNVARMTGFLGFLQGLLAAVGVMASIVVVTVGFGAVVLTRGGRRPDLAYAEDFRVRDAMWGGGWKRWRRERADAEEEVQGAQAQETASQGAAEEPRRQSAAEEAPSGDSEDEKPESADA